MAACEVCGDASHLSHDCRYCNGAYCTDHLLPENHDCVAVGGAVTLGPEFRHVGDRNETGNDDGTAAAGGDRDPEDVLDEEMPTHECPKCGTEIAVTRLMCAECRIGSTDDGDDADPIPKHDCEGCGTSIPTTRNVCPECLNPETDDTTAQEKAQSGGPPRRLIAAVLVLAAVLYVWLLVLG